MQKEQPYMELYIHIPFCVQKCRYCDFLSYPADLSTKEKYVEMLCREIRVRSRYFLQKKISSIFIGGGTPSCLPSQMLERIMTTVFENFTVEDHAEISIEVNPGTVDTEKLQVYKRIGINRLSIGLQSTDNDVLTLLGRIHTVEEFEKTYLDARRVGFKNINIDLMSALPGQTSEALKETLEQAIEWNPEHISCYSLIVEEGTPFFDMKDQLVFPDEDEDREMYAMTGRILQKYGYNRYEISNYAKVGMESIHNCGYWTRVPYLGLGIGAASLIEERRFSNPRNMDDYEQMILEEEKEGFDTFLQERTHAENILQKTRHWEELTVLTKEEQMEEFMFLGLRMMKGVSKKEFVHSFGISIEDVYGNVLKKLMKDELIRIKGENICLTEYGIDISNYVFSQFLF